MNKHEAENDVSVLHKRKETKRSITYYHRGDVVLLLLLVTIIWQLCDDELPSLAWVQLGFVLVLCRAFSFLFLLLVFIFIWCRSKWSVSGPRQRLLSVDCIGTACVSWKINNESLKKKDQTNSGKRTLRHRRVFQTDGYRPRLPINGCIFASLASIINVP